MVCKFKFIRYGHRKKKISFYVPWLILPALQTLTRLISIESQPKKIVVVVVVVIVIVVVVVVNIVHIVVVLISGVDPRNLPLKFGFNQVINR